MPSPIQDEQPLPGETEEDPIGQFRKRQRKDNDSYEEYQEVPDEVIEEPEEQGE